MIWPLYRYILMAAGRDRFFFSIVGVLAVVAALSTFFGSSALTEKDQFMQSFAAYGFRLFGVVSLVFFVVGYIRRCFENRDIEYLLSRPMGRISFILTHAAAFSSLAFITAAILGGVTVWLSQGTQGHHGLLLWWLSIAAEFVIIANVAMFFAFVVNSATACMLVVFAFYLLARLMGEILGILHKAQDGLIGLLGKIMEMISIFIPRLDLMGQTKWILYGISPDISLPFIIGQAGIFTALVIGATCIDMHRRQF
jgi:hypothetical protein